MALLAARCDNGQDVLDETTSHLNGTSILSPFPPLGSGGQLRAVFHGPGAKALGVCRPAPAPVFAPAPGRLRTIHAGATRHRGRRASWGAPSGAGPGTQPFKQAARSAARDLSIRE